MRPRYPEGVHPVLVEKVTLVVARAAARGLTFHIYCGSRDRTDQAALYAQGRSPLSVVNDLRQHAGLAPILEAQNQIVTHAPPGMSLHERQPARAVDGAVVRDGRTLEWDAGVDLNVDGIPDYQEVGELAEAVGLVWGGRFRKPDWGHLELSKAVV